MKKFEIIDSENKKCPDCGETILLKWTAAFNDEWCPHCGCNMDDVFPKIDVKEKDFNKLPVFENF